MRIESGIEARERATHKHTQTHTETNFKQNSKSYPPFFFENKILKIENAAKAVQKVVSAALCRLPIVQLRRRTSQTCIFENLLL